MRVIEILARGVCIRKGRVLVCHTAGASNTYLPGGHVEFNESAPVSLVREIREEMGRSARAGRFLGVVEHTFVQRGERHCEVNLVFEVNICGLDPTLPPQSREGHLDFRWLPLSNLAASDLEPAPLRRDLAKWVRRTAGSGWASTLGRSAAAAGRRRRSA